MNDAPSPETLAYPFVKWAGGKGQLLDAIHARMPQQYGRYFEPFVGGGALFFSLQPQDALINDINTALVNTYLRIRDDAEEVIAALSLLDEAHLSSTVPKANYFAVRARYNELIGAGIYTPETAALLIFINKHCFNGLYRVNAKGLFNVPFNGSSQASYTRENILAVSEALKGATILNGDFEAACEGAAEGDFVFFDSPYAPLNPTSFEAYTKEGFAQEEHERLARLFRRLTDTGCFCMLTNHNTPLIRELYDGFTIDVVEVRRAINSDASKRTGTEVIIRNY